MYLLVTNKYATYHELAHVYTLDEAIDLIEICLVNLYNRARLTESKK